LIPIALLLLRWRKQGRPDRVVLGAYLVLAGALRFAIEFIRINERVFGIFTVAHLASLTAVIAGVGLLLWRGAASTSTAGRTSPRPQKA
jgi:prolipoprotein diacylglyceryltransferase